MKVSTHIIIGVIISLLLLFFYKSIRPFYIIIFFLSSFLIDIDHYIFYVYMTGDWSITKSYYAFLNLPESRDYKNSKKHIWIFHGCECWILLLILSCLHPLFIYVCLGVALHMILDLILLYDKNYPLYIKLSQILVWFDKTHTIEDFKNTRNKKI